MDQRDEFSKWISAVEEALSDEGKTLAEDTSDCDCGEYSCLTCFPDIDKEDDKHDHSKKSDRIATKIASDKNNIEADELAEEPEEQRPKSKGVKLGDIVTTTKTELKMSGGQNSPMTYGEDNLDEIEEEVPGMDVEQPLFGEDEDNFDHQEEWEMGSPLTKREHHAEMSQIDPDEAMELIKAITGMQSGGLSNANHAYSEQEMANMTADELRRVHAQVTGDIAEETEKMPSGSKPEPKPTEVDDEEDPFWGDMDTMFNPKPDQPLATAVGSDDEEEIGSDEPSMTLPSAGRDATRQKTANIKPDDEMRSWMNRINPTAGAGEPERPETPQNELVVRTASDVPAVITNAIQASGMQSPEWHGVQDLPGFQEANIRGMGRQIFGMFTSTPVEQIQTIANVKGQGPNTDAEMRAVAGWLRDNAEDLGQVDLSHGMAIPGYKPDVKEYSANGVRFHVVRDPMGQYIYAYPDKDARLGGPAGRKQQGRLGAGNTPRLRESTKATGKVLSLFEELKLDEQINAAFSQLILEEANEIDESTLSKEIAWYPGGAGTQKKKQGGWNLLQLLHKKGKFDDEAEMTKLPFERDVLYGYFKNHPDHFIILQGTDGVAAIRPSEEYFAHKRKKDPSYSRDPNKEKNDPNLQYQVIAFKNDGAQLDPALFQAEADKKDAGGAEGSKEDKFYSQDPSVRRLRMGLYHGKDTQSANNVFELLSQEIGRLNYMWISGFHALRKGQIGKSKGAEPEIKPHTGSVDREKLKQRADLKKGAAPMNAGEAKSKVFNKIRPILQPIVAKAYSKVTLALQDAVRDDHQEEIERLSAIRKIINQFKQAVDISGDVPITGAVATVIDKAIQRAVGVASNDRAYPGVLSDLATGPAIQLQPLVQSLRKTLIGAVR